jgi:transglutaminase-like putative cysteine protease
VVNFSSVVHLIGRYPELGKNKDFYDWTRKHGAKTWHEQLESDRVTVVVQSLDGLYLFAAQIKREQDYTKPQMVLRTTSIDLLHIEVLRDTALIELKRTQKIDVSRIHAVRPVVTFTPDGSVKVSWEIETISDGTDREIFLFDKEEGARVLKTEKIEIPTKREPPRGDNRVPPLSDALADNELHHLTQMSADATTAAGGATTSEGRARGIFNYVRLNYAYDATIFRISEFTWADILTRNTNGRRGICDEWAVVQISMLRSLGIPARLKFLIWQNAGKSVGHACLEYQDGNLWFHMDALWNAFHNPGVYRVSGGATNVTVMDADYPVDSRSTVPAWDQPDSTGDMELNPYADFIIIPNYPGNSRPGYSF